MFSIFYFSVLTFPNVLQLTPSFVDLHMPTKTTAPTAQWVEEMGMPVYFVLINHVYFMPVRRSLPEEYGEVGFRVSSCFSRGMDFSSIQTGTILNIPILAQKSTVKAVPSSTVKPDGAET